MTEPTLPTSRRNLNAANLLLALIVCIFAFLAASFAARNSDVWLHLASGRLLAQDHYTFGVDPFSYTTDGAYWANHAWLFDLGLYAGFQKFGGAVMVILKAVGVMALAAVMLRISRPRHGKQFWIGGGCVLLAILAMSPRLQLQPMCVSFFLLAVCLLLLRVGGKALYAIPVLIAVWVNLDDWYILGPMVVALFGAGSAFAPRGAKTAESCPCLPIWLIPACFVACLCSPHHIHGLSLPAELSPAVWRSDLPNDGRFQSLFASPWHWEFLGRSGGSNLSGGAFFILLFLGAISFAVNWTAIRSWRSVVWLAFAGLAAWQIRLVPFFAVVTGPIAALNFRSLSDAPQSHRLASVFGWLGVATAGMILSALTWPGWLQGFHRHDRPLEWAIEADPSLKAAAETTAIWRNHGEIPPDARIFAFHPDVANYLVWFCPGERSFLDSRWPLFTPVLAENRKICAALDPSLRRPENPFALSSEQLLHDRKITYVILYDPDIRRLASSLHTVANSPESWEILCVDGAAVFVRWKDRSIPDTTPHPRPFDADRKAFAHESQFISAEPKPEPLFPLARPLPWWFRYLDRPSGTSREANAAAVYLQLSEEEAAPYLKRQREAVVARHMAGLIGLPAAPIASLPALTALTVKMVAPANIFMPELQERPAALPLLAIRAAREAISSHPDDATAWFRLAQAYQSLSRSTVESTTYDPFSPLMQIRQIQIVTALVQAVTLNPDLTTAHEALAMVFTDSSYLDLALKHREIQFRLTQQAGPLPGEDDPTFAKRIEGFDKEIERFRNRVQDNQNRYTVRAQSMTGDPLGRARLALQLGLAGKALDEVLLKVPIELYGADGIPDRDRLLLELLLVTGRSEDVRDLLDAEELQHRPNSLGFYELPGGPGWSYRLPAYDWCDLCRSAAAGDYKRAGLALERVRNRIQTEGKASRSTLDKSFALRTASEIGLGATPETALLRQIVQRERDNLTKTLIQRQYLQVEWADLHTLEGMLLLESGQPKRAAVQFSLAQLLYERTTSVAPSLPGQYVSRRYLDRIRE